VPNAFEAPLFAFFGDRYRRARILLAVHLLRGVACLAAAAALALDASAGPFSSRSRGWGLPLALIGIWPETGVARVALAASGCANSLLDVAGFTSMQEHVDDRLLSRVFGFFELVVIVSVALGSLAAPALLDLLGSRGALVGVLLPFVALLAHRALGESTTAWTCAPTSSSCCAGRSCSHRCRTRPSAGSPPLWESSTPWPAKRSCGKGRTRRSST
jgi:MFS family permease